MESLGSRPASGAVGPRDAANRLWRRGLSEQGDPLERSRPVGGPWSHPRVSTSPTPGRSGWDLRAVAALLHVGRPAALHGRQRRPLPGRCSTARTDPIEVVVPARAVGRRARDGIDDRAERDTSTSAWTPAAWPHRVTAAHTVSRPRRRARPSIVSAGRSHGQARAAAPLHDRAARLARPSQAGRGSRAGGRCSEALGEVRAPASRAQRSIATSATSSVRTGSPSDGGRAHRLPDNVTGTALYDEATGRAWRWTAGSGTRAGPPGPSTGGRDLDGAVAGWLTGAAHMARRRRHAPCGLAADLDAIFSATGGGPAGPSPATAQRASSIRQRRQLTVVSPTPCARCGPQGHRMAHGPAPAGGPAAVRRRSRG